MIHLQTPLTKEKIASLKAGDRVLLSGVIYTSRDAAHKRFCKMLERGEKLPFEVQDATIYFAGPAPAAPGEVVGSCGPTTSYRMDAYSPRMLAEGLRGMIGKGKRNDEVKEAIKKYQGIYFGAIGGAGALISNCIKKCDVIAFADLGPEAVRRLEVEDLPLVVVIDCQGHDLYELGRRNYLEVHHDA